MSLLSSQLMYLYSVSYYSKVLKSEKEILDATKTSNPYRLKMAYKTLNCSEAFGVELLRFLEKKDHVYLSVGR